MGEIIPIREAVERRAATVHDAWERYVAAQNKAKETLEMSDGIAAAKAWADWLDMFVGRR